MVEKSNAESVKRKDRAQLAAEDAVPIFEPKPRRTLDEIKNPNGPEDKIDYSDLARSSRDDVWMTVPICVNEYSSSFIQALAYGILGEYGFQAEFFDEKPPLKGWT
jgi:hypothetical protein